MGKCNTSLVSSSSSQDFNCHKGQADGDDHQHCTTCCKWHGQPSCSSHDDNMKLPSIVVLLLLTLLLLFLNAHWIALYSHCHWWNPNKKIHTRIHIKAATYYNTDPQNSSPPAPGHPHHILLPSARTLPLTLVYCYSVWQLPSYYSCGPTGTRLRSAAPWPSRCV